MGLELGIMGFRGEMIESKKAEKKSHTGVILWGGRGVPLAGAPMNGKVFSNLNIWQSNQFRSPIFVDKIIFNSKY